MSYRTTNIRFPSNGTQLAGTVYAPQNSTTASLPAIIVDHSTTGRKAQPPNVYASGLATQGFLVLTFDAYQGESKESPRGLESPVERAEDFRSAVSYLATRNDADAERIGVMGMCRSGSYAMHAVHTDQRIKAGAAVSATDISQFLHTSAPKKWHTKVSTSRADRTAESREDEPAMLVPPELTDETSPRAAARFFEDGKTLRGQHLNLTGASALRSAARSDQFDAFPGIAETFPRPLMMIAGTKAATRGFSERMVTDLGNSAELALIEGATHSDLYDRDPYVDHAIWKLTVFFSTHLKTEA